MQKDNINMLAIAGHKGLFASQGVGALLIEDVELKPIKFGGTGTDSISVLHPTGAPECFEAGTLATPNILSLKAGVEFVMRHQKNIEEKLKRQTKMLINGIKEVKDIKIYTDFNSSNGVVAFNIGDIDFYNITSLLSSVTKRLSTIY